MAGIHTGLVQVTASRAHQQRKQRTGVQGHCFRCLISAGSKPVTPLLAARHSHCSNINQLSSPTDLQCALLNRSRVTTRLQAQNFSHIKGSSDGSQAVPTGMEPAGRKGSTQQANEQPQSTEPGQEEGQGEQEAGSKEQPADEESGGVKVALAVLRFYKREISPILPPSCRFLPTCSEYAMESFQTFGVGRGAVLTAWRLLRCNPFGPSGYDPVQWPPPGLKWMIKS